MPAWLRFLRTTRSRHRCFCPTAPGSSGSGADDLYLAFENVFYDHDVVSRSFRFYTEILAAEVPFIEGRRATVDLGAGRGGSGADARAWVRRAGRGGQCSRGRDAQDSGIPIIECDAASYLDSLEDGSLSGSHADTSRRAPAAGLPA